MILHKKQTLEKTNTMMSNVYTALSQALYFSANFVSSTIAQGRSEHSDKASAQLSKTPSVVRMGGVFILLAVLNPVSMKAQDSFEPVFGLNYFAEVSTAGDRVDPATSGGHLTMNIATRSLPRAVLPVLISPMAVRLVPIKPYQTAVTRPP